MGWDISLVDEDGTPVEVDEHTEGSAYAVGGTSEAELSLTFNYSWFYYQVLDDDDGLRWLDGRRAGDCIDRLEDAVDDLGTKQWSERCDAQDCGYWAPTPGNAGHALNVLLQWAEEHPDATFEVV